MAAASILKFLCGFNIFDGEKFAKLVFYFIVIAVAIGIYHKTFVAATYKTVQHTKIEKPAQVNIYSEQPGAKDKFLGLHLWKVKLGASW